MTSDYMTCRSCGASVRLDDGVCGSCGAEVERGYGSAELPSADLRDYPTGSGGMEQDDVQSGDRMSDSAADYAPYRHDRRSMDGDDSIAVGPRVNFLPRLGAFIIDLFVTAGVFTVIVMVLGLVSAYELPELEEILEQETFPLPLYVLLVVAGLHEPILMSRFGTSVGKRIANIYVVDGNSSRPSLGIALLRYAVKTFLLNVPILGVPITAIPVIVRRDRRGIHDIVAGTYPIRHANRDGGWILDLDSPGLDT